MICVYNTGRQPYVGVLMGRHRQQWPNNEQRFVQSRLSHTLLIHMIKSVCKFITKEAHFETVIVYIAQPSSIHTYLKVTDIVYIAQPSSIQT